MPISTTQARGPDSPHGSRSDPPIDPLRPRRYTFLLRSRTGPNFLFGRSPACVSPMSQMTLEFSLASRAHPEGHRFLARQRRAAAASLLGLGGPG
jgi:hypothetical protein